MTDKPKLGWLVMEESHLGAMVLGFYTEKHKAMAAAEGYAEKHYVRLGGSFFGPSIIQTAKRAATRKGWRPLERPVRPY